ncbi:MAG: DUF2156 domain-containing protein [Lachnospiraceae bacterium]|nr:DUF2156 domain-containing protein [Lachnospiraceae bacterium]
MMLIEFKRPQLEDKEVLSEYFWNYPSRSCDRTFVNGFLWSRFYNGGFAVIEDTLVFEDELNGQYSYSYPAGTPENIKKAILCLEELCREKGIPLALHAVTPDQFAQLEQLFPGKFQIEYNRDWADYVYESEKLATLSGKKLHSKRNHVNRFMATHDNWTYEKLTKENVEECFQMALLWRKENGCDDDEDKNEEMCVTLNSLRLFEELGVVGGILRVDGRIVAFTMGEPICEDTFVVHIEKAFADVDGAYTVINQQFVQHECLNYKYVNREEDTGAEGLRKAKLSYKPAFLVEKGMVTCVEQEKEQ